MVVQIQCPSCSASFPVDLDKIPEEGATLGCHSCAHVFRVERPTSIDGLAPDTAPEVAAEPEPEVAPEPEPVVAAEPEPEVESVVEITADLSMKAPARPDPSSEGGFDERTRAGESPVTIEDLDAPAEQVSSHEDRSRLLSEVVAHAETREINYRQPSRESRRSGQWKGPLALVVLMLAAYIGFAPPPWLAGEPLPQVSSAERGRGVVAALQMQARQIEVFQARHGRLPRSLDEVPVRIPDVRFVRSNSRVYQLVAARPNGRALVYDSAKPDPEFEEVEKGWDPGPRP